jgi:hypothetical protein
MQEHSLQWICRLEEELRRELRMAPDHQLELPNFPNGHLPGCSTSIPYTIPGSYRCDGYERYVEGVARDVIDSHRRCCERYPWSVNLVAWRIHATKRSARTMNAAEFVIQLIIQARVID